MLANFRACGGRYKKKKILVLPTNHEEINNIKNSVTTTDKEVFDPINHQRLAVLFCSFSSESNNAPAFCVNPW